MYYITLCLLFGGGLFLAIVLAPHHLQQTWAMLFVAVSYVLAGVVHHMVHHRLSVKVVLEYTVVALFGLSLVYFITQIV